MYEVFSLLYGMDRMSLDEDSLLNSSSHSTDFEDIVESSPLKLVKTLNQKINIHSTFYKNLYSDSVRQRDVAVQLLEAGNTSEAIALLRDFPKPIGAPATPRGVIKRRKKTEDIDQILAELRGNYSVDNNQNISLPIPDKRVDIQSCISAIQLC